MKAMQGFGIKKSVRTLAATALFCVFGFSHSVQADDKLTAAMPQLTLEMAKKAAMSALRQCRRDGYAVSVAVVDRSGVLITQVRNPAAGPHTIGSSLGKAFTSASMGRATAPLANAIAENPALNGLRDMDSRMVILAGGLPIMINGQRVGGIGVGGAPGGHLDEACAMFGLQQIGAQ
jgi:uncharacterized protein GlcG (DUF336 family)